MTAHSLQKVPAARKAWLAEPRHRKLELLQFVLKMDFMDKLYACAGFEVVVRPYQNSDREAFRQLNVEWIEHYFEMEPEDYCELDHPERIIEHGGAILIAARAEVAVGCCALIRKDESCFELAKLAVTPKAQGLHVGWKLCCAAVAEARRLGAQRLRLDSNTKLKPAIGLYRKLGFRQIPDQPTPFQRVDIQMELMLDECGFTGGRQGRIY